MSTSNTHKKADPTPPNADWKVYIIVANDGKLYTGITNNITKRWEQHCAKRGAKFFFGRQPVALAYLEGGHCRRSASQQEYEIKQRSRKEKWRLIIDHYGPFEIKPKKISQKFVNL